jgi:hypothetical protein
MSCSSSSSSSTIYRPKFSFVIGDPRQGFDFLSMVAIGRHRRLSSRIHVDENEQTISHVDLTRLTSPTTITFS